MTGNPRDRFQRLRPPVRSHQHSVGVSTGSAHQNPGNKKQGRRRGKAALKFFPFFQRDPRCLPRHHRNSEEACCWSFCQANHRQLFQGYAHLSPSRGGGDVFLRFAAPHRTARTHCHLHAGTPCCRRRRHGTHIRTGAPVSLRGRALTRTEVTVTRADIVKSGVHKGFFSLCSSTNGSRRPPPGAFIICKETLADFPATHTQSRRLPFDIQG